MTGLPTSSISPAGAGIRPPLPAGAALGDGSDGRPISALIPAPRLRDETLTRRPRQDLGEERGGRVPADYSPFGQTRPRQNRTPPAAAPAFASSLFLAQVLSQDRRPAGTVLALHRDGPVLGSDAYRRAGGEPVIYSEQPQLLRIAV